MLTAAAAIVQSAVFVFLVGHEHQTNADHPFTRTLWVLLAAANWLTTAVFDLSLAGAVLYNVKTMRLR